VAFGTSAPEFTVSMIASIQSHGDVALGNVFGSNIFNIAVIIGLSAIINPLVVNLSLIKKDIPIMILASFTAIPIVLSEGVSRLYGFGLIVFFGTYIFYALLRVKRDPDKIEEVISGAVKAKLRIWILDAILILGGIAILIVGSNLLVSGAISVARCLGISEAIIALTIISAGTSLPEFATSVVAAFRKNSDIAVGNIVGSNIFNIFCILGTASIISPIQIQNIGVIVPLFIILTSVLLLPVAITDKKITRVEGILFLTTYAVYLYLIWPY
jgi:cation:H+ antiporter